MGEKERHTPEGEGRYDEEEGELRQLFALGQIVATPGALQALEEAEQEPLELLLRHVTGDWGQIPEEDVEENERSVREGYRILSSYRLDTGPKVWLITEGDCSMTTLLSPAEY